MAARVFRLFVSSTFTDFVAERNALHASVFPRLRALCDSRGARFQAIDLRWGISDEAALDQQTLPICVQEVMRCRRITPQPNFLFMLGQRCGWRPLPAWVDAHEFEAIVDRLSRRGARFRQHRALLRDWYVRDVNAVPARYRLRPREGAAADLRVWSALEAQMRSALLEAVVDLELSPEARLKYEASATEQEIRLAVLGARTLAEPLRGDLAASARSAAEGRGEPATLAGSGQAHGFFRTIDGLPPDPRARLYLDLDESGRPDLEAASRIERLKDELRAALPEAVREHRAEWRSGRISTAHLAPMCADLFASLARVIRSELGAEQDDDPLTRERAAHRAHGRRLTVFFTGRERDLAAIRRYAQSEGRCAYAVHGAPGTGKSTLLAQAAEEARATRPDSVVVARHIGATPASSLGWALIRDVCGEISHAYGVVTNDDRVPHVSAGDGDVPLSDGEAMAALFRDHLQMASAARPLLVVLDALDQLGESDPARNLDWLPAELPPHVHIVLSATPEWEIALARRLPSSHLRTLRSMPMSQGRRLLARWLEDAGRRLQPRQTRSVLTGFGACGLPLYLKLAFEEARRWTSSEAPRALPRDMAAMAEALFDRLASRTTHGAVLVDRAIGYLAAARNGLTEDELLDVLSADRAVLVEMRRRSRYSPPSRRLPVVLWSRLYLDLAPYLTEREADGTSLLAFYHRQLGDVARARFLAGSNGTARAAHLARYFASQPLHHDRSRANLRRLAELPHAQARAGRSRELRGTLTRYEVMAARVGATGPQSLIEDYDLARAPEVRFSSRTAHSMLAIQQALRMSAHVVARDPSQLAAQLLGRMPMRGSAEARSLRAQTAAMRTEPWLRPLRPSLSGTSGPLRFTLTGHNERVRAVAITRDGRTAVSGDVDGVLKTWDLARGRCVRTFASLAPWVRSVVLSPDEQQFVTIAEDGALRLWDLETGRLVHTMLGRTGMAASVAFLSADRLVAGTRGGALALWDLQRGRRLRMMRGPDEASIASLVVTRDSRRAFGGNWGNDILLWDLARGRVVDRLKGHRHIVYALALSTDERRIVSASGDGTVKVWDLSTRSCLHTLQAYTKRVYGLALLGGDRRAVSAGRDGTMRIWNLESGRQVAILEAHTRRAYQVAVAGNGVTAVSASDDGTLKVWDLAHLGGRDSRPVHGGEVGSLALTADGRRLFSASSDWTVKTWDTLGSAPPRNVGGRPGGSRGVILAPDGSRAIFGSGMSAISLWEARHAGATRLLVRQQIKEAGREASERRIPAVVDRAAFVAISADGRRVAIVVGQAVDIRETRTGGLDCRFEIAGDLAIAVALSGDGTRAWVLTQNGTLNAWELESGRRIVRRLAGLPCMFAAAIAPQAGMLVLAAESSPIIEVRQLSPSGNRARRVTTLNGHSSSVLRVAIDAGGARAMSGAADGTIGLWDLARGQPIARVRAHRGQVFCVALSPDGRRAFSSGEDKLLKVWNVRRARRLETIRPKPSFVYSMGVADDGKRAVVASQGGFGMDGSVYTWHLGRRHPPRTLFAAEGVMLGGAISPDGRWAALVHSEGRITLWNLEDKALVRLIDGIREPVSEITFTSSGRLAFIAGGRRELIRPDAAQRAWAIAERRRAARRARSGLASLRAVSLGGRVRVHTGDDGRLVVSRVRPGARRTASLRLEASSKSVESFLITPDGRRGLSIAEATLTAWDLRSGTAVARFTGESSLTAAAISRDGRIFAAGEAQGRVHILRLESV